VTAAYLAARNLATVRITWSQCATPPKPVPSLWSVAGEEVAHPRANENHICEPAKSVKRRPATDAKDLADERHRLAEDGNALTKRRRLTARWALHKFNHYMR
jgi:hypothetical protein